MRQILNAHAWETVLAVSVLGTVALTLIAVVVAKKVFPNIADGHFEDTADAMRTVYELVYSLILAFVIGSVLSAFGTASSAASSEAASIDQLTRLNAALPLPAQNILNDGIDQYVHAIVDSDWPAMRNGKESSRGAAGLETLYALYNENAPQATNAAEEAVYSQAFDELNTLNQDRRARLELSAADLPVVLRIALPLGAVVLLMLEFRPKLPLRDQLVHLGILAAVVSFAYLLTILVDYPYSGDVAVGTESFKTGALARFWTPDEPHVMSSGEKQVKLTPEVMTGVWDSTTFGEMDFRQVGDEIIGVYRHDQGTVEGQINTDGVFQGWWCESPTRLPTADAGDVQWTLVKTSGSGEVAYGSWRYGAQGALHGGWDLEKVGGPEPPDMAPRFGDAASFCRHP